MGAFIDIASVILAKSEQSVEVSAQNVANIATPGYKSRVSFSQALEKATAVDSSLGRAPVGINFGPGKLTQSSNPYDLAISGNGFFVLSTDRGPVYTRDGQFQLDRDGRLVSDDGLPVQAQGGGDIEIKGRNKDAVVSIAADGSVLEDGEPVAKLDIVDFIDKRAATWTQAGRFVATDSNIRPVDNPVVRQGWLEASNVSNAEEMMSMMEALRRAQSGQKLVNVYDDLMGRALSIFGQA